MTITNCWEFMNCGREAGGHSVDELGVCPAYRCHAGDACWLVVGTFCASGIQGHKAREVESCRDCEFYQQFDLRHRMQIRQRLAGFVDLKNRIIVK